MKLITILSIATILVACSNQNKEKEKSELNEDSTLKSIKSDILEKEFITSVYDHPIGNVKSNQSGLKELSDSNVFSVIHSKLFETLSKNHKDFFTSRPDYQLLYNVSGDLFQNKTESMAFIVYDKQNVRISFLTFNAATKKYSELYRRALNQRTIRNHFVFQLVLFTITGSV